MSVSILASLSDILFFMSTCSCSCSELSTWLSLSITFSLNFDIFQEILHKKITAHIIELALIIIGVSTDKSITFEIKYKLLYKIRIEYNFTSIVCYVSWDYHLVSVVIYIIDIEYRKSTLFPISYSVSHISFFWQCCELSVFYFCSHFCKNKNIKLVFINPNNFWINWIYEYIMSYCIYTYYITSIDTLHI